MSLLLLACASAMAQTSERLQNNDLALTGGGQFAFSNPLDLGAAWALEGAFAHALMPVPLVSLSAELPVAGSFTSSVPTLNGFRVARSYNALFITPGVRLRLAPSFPLSPYLSAGIGYARFNRQYFDGTTSPTSTMAFDIGGGPRSEGISFDQPARGDPGFQFGRCRAAVARAGTGRIMCL